MSYETLGNELAAYKKKIHGTRVDYEKHTEGHVKKSKKLKPSSAKGTKINVKEQYES